MKKLVYFFVILIVAGCNQEIIEQNKPSNRIDEKYYSDFGKLHNEGLDHVLEQLKSLKECQFKSVSKEILHDEVIRASINFVNEKDEIDRSLEDLVTNVSSQTLSYNRRQKGIAATLKNLSEGLTETDVRRSHYQQFGDVTDSQLDYIGQMEKIFNGQNQIDIIKALIDLKGEVIAELTEEEAFPILCGIYTGIYSLNYWKENALKWQSSLMDLEHFDGADIGTLNSTLKGNPIVLSQFVNFPDGVYPWPDEPTLAIRVRDGRITIIRGPDGTVFDSNLRVFTLPGSVEFNWSKLSGADWQGAVGGAVGGFISGSAAGGVGAVPGTGIGFVAGGVGSSAAEAIRQLIFY